LDVVTTNHAPMAHIGALVYLVTEQAEIVIAPTILWAISIAYNFF
jgi:hypothetical protein